MLYRAHDAVLDRDVAAKVLYEHLGRDPRIRERFIREGRPALPESGARARPLSPALRLAPSP
ncbi:MAG: hypothetical protein U0531_08655, partial [Dehalococcoidia bacterium]